MGGRIIPPHRRDPFAERVAALQLGWDNLFRVFLWWIPPRSEAQSLEYLKGVLQ